MSPTKLIAAKCPECSASLQIPEDRESAFCTYCGKSIVVERARSLTPDVQSLLNMAETTFEAGNYEESLTYYNRVLEFEPKNSHAWTRRALCTTRITKGGEIRDRYREASTYIEKALECVVQSQENKSENQDSSTKTEILDAREEIKGDMALFAVSLSKDVWDSIQDLRREAQPGFFGLRDEIGNDYWKSYRERLEDASEYCRVALEIDPEHLVAWENLALFQSEMGNKNESVQMQQRIAHIKARRFCSKCNQEYSGEGKYCDKCGNPRPQMTS